MSHLTKRIALGSAQFGMNYGISNVIGKVESVVVGEILAHAKSHNVCVIDTAIAYGESEQVLGSHDLTGFEIITKLPAIPIGKADVQEWCIEQVMASKARLKIDKLSGLLLHKPEQLHGKLGQELKSALRLLQDEGHVDKIGVSIYDPDEIPKVLESIEIDIIQAPFNIIDRRLVTSGWLRQLSDMKIEVHTRSSFMQGLLLMRPAAIPKKFAIWKDLWHDWDKWRNENELSAVEACLQFVLAEPMIAKVIVGIDSLGQLNEIIEATLVQKDLQMPDDISCSDRKLLNPSEWSKL